MSFTFTTPCLPMQLPYYENFEGYTGVTSYTDEVLPDCWSRINTGSYSYYLGMPIIYGSATYAQSGMNSLYFYTNQSMTTDYGNLYAILPEIDTDVHPLNTLQISFAARKYLSSYDCYLVVGAIEDVTDPTTFVPVDTLLDGRAPDEDGVWRDLRLSSHFVSQMSLDPRHKFAKFLYLAERMSEGLEYEYDKYGYFFSNP